jgi:hypothetical protein
MEHRSALTLTAGGLITVPSAGSRKRGAWRSGPSTSTTGTP